MKRGRTKSSFNTVNPSNLISPTLYCSPSVTGIVNVTHFTGFFLNVPDFPSVYVIRGDPTRAVTYPLFK